MKHGFINVAAAAPEVRVGDIDFNLKSAIDAFSSAERSGVEVLVLPEMHLTSYTCGDLFFNETLIDSAKEALVSLRNFSLGKNAVVIVGCPISTCGKLYNCAAVIHNGSILGIVPKTYLPNYGEFYEMRQFSSGKSYYGPDSISIGGKQVPFGIDLLFCNRDKDDYIIGVEICEDLWAPVSPSSEMCLAGATVIANLSSSDELIGKDEYRRQLVSSVSSKLICAYIYANSGTGESTQDMVFSGHSMIYENGVSLSERLPFENGSELLTAQADLFRISGERQRNTSFVSHKNNFRRIYFEQISTNTELTRVFASHPFVPDSKNVLSERAEEILRIQSYGLCKRLSHIGKSTVVIGISGGLDSTLALFASIRAIDILHRSRKEIICVTMPCFGTTDRTLKNAISLCEYLGVTFKNIDIRASVEQHFKDISHDPNVTDTTYENCQARERTQVLMDIANEVGGIVVGTGDLSELALGWATYNGDHMSMYGINSSIPKTLVRYIIEYEAMHSPDNIRAVLSDILDTPISPELLPAAISGDISQKTEDLVGPYELHDFFLYHMLRTGAGPDRIFALAKCSFSGRYDESVILKWLRVFTVRFFAQQFKRSCLPDGPKIGTVTLSPRGDWRMPSDACCTLWLNKIDALSKSI